MREIGIRPAEAFRERPRDGFDLGLEALVDKETEVGGPRDQLYRAVVVGRPQSSGHDAEIGPERVAERRLELVRRVADDRDARGIEAERERRVREERPVAVVAVSTHELAARGDDRDPGSRGRNGMGDRMNPVHAPLVAAGQRTSPACG